MGFQGVVSVLEAAASDGRLAALFGAAISRYAPSNLPLGHELKVFAVDDVVNMCHHDETCLAYLQQPSISELRHPFWCARETLFDRGSFYGVSPELVYSLMERAGISPNPYLTMSLASDREPNGCHEVIASLLSSGALHHAITTNFDELVEAVSERDIGSSVPGECGDTRVPERGALYKIHGTVSSAESMQVTLEDVQRGLSAPRRAVLADTCRTYALLVMGYSGNDDDIMECVVEHARYPIIWILRPDEAKGPAGVCSPEIVCADDLAEDEAKLADHVRRVHVPVYLVRCDVSAFLMHLSRALSREEQPAEIRPLPWQAQPLIPHGIQPERVDRIPSLEEVCQFLVSLYREYGRGDIAKIGEQLLTDDIPQFLSQRTLGQQDANGGPKSSERREGLLVVHPGFIRPTEAVPQALRDEHANVRYVFDECPAPSGSQPVPVLYEALLSMPDALGVQSAFIGAETSTPGKVEFIHLVFDDIDGLREYEGRLGEPVAKEELDCSLRALRENPRLLISPVEMAFLRPMVVSALRGLSDERTQFPTWEHVLHAKPKPDDGEFLEAFKELERKMCARETYLSIISETPLLFSLPAFRSWVFRSVGDVSTQVAYILPSQYTPELAIRLWVTPKYREKLEARLVTSAYILSRLGREDLARLSLAAGRSVRTGVPPLEDNPFLVQMAIHTIREAMMGRC